MAGATNLRKAPPARSPGRDALAAAIAEQRAVDERRVALVTAREAAGAAALAARLEVSAAKDAIVVARDGVAEHLVATGAMSPAVREARVRLLVAEDELAAATAASDRLKKEVDDDFPSYRLEKRLSDTRIEVCRTDGAAEIEATLATVECLMKELGRHGGELQAMARIGVFTTNEVPGASYGKIVDPRISAILSQMDSAPSGWGGGRGAPTKWSGAFEALRLDPDAELPAADKD